MINSLLSKLKDDERLRVVALSLNNGTLAERLKSSGIRTYVIPEPDNSFISIFIKARRIFRELGIDAIHCHRYKENLLGFLLSRPLGVKKLFTTLHGMPELEAKPMSIEGIKTRIDLGLLKKHFTVVAVSQEMKKSLITKYGFSEDRIKTIYNGITMPEVKPSQEAQLRVGTAARFVPVKDLHLFLEAASIVARKAKNAVFSILGDGPLKSTLLDHAQQLNLGRSVEFLAQRENPLFFYGSLSIYMNTSKHEGIPMSVLEAMSLCKPVIAPCVGGIPEIIKDGHDGFLVNSRDPQDFADICLKLINDRALRKSIGEAARAKVSAGFNAVSMARAYASAYLDQ